MGCVASENKNAAEKEKVCTNSEINRDHDFHDLQPSASPKTSKTNLRKKSRSTHSKATASNKEDREHSHSSVSLSWNLDAEVPDDRKDEFQLKISQSKSRIEEEAKKIALLKKQSFEAQLSRQKSHQFVGLYELFKHHATNEPKMDIDDDTNGPKMDIDGVTEALKEFGMIIDTNSDFRKLVYSKFDIDREGEIDYNDFMATISSFIGTKDEDTLILMFQIFDIDQDGYLNTEDVARLLLAQNQISVIVTGHIADEETPTLNKRQCLKLAMKMITKSFDQYDGSKISFDEFKTMMMKVTTEKMMIDNMSGLPSMDAIPTPRST